MASYIYSITTDFPNGIRTDQLQSEINASGISQSSSRIDTDGDVVTIYFPSSLSGGDVTILNATIAAHIPAYPADTHQMLGTFTQTVTDTTYTTVRSFYFPGSQLITLLNIYIISYMDSGTSYQVRLYDVTNSNVIASGSFTNTVTATNALTGITNIPSGGAMFDVQCAVTGATTAHVSAISLYFNEDMQDN